MDKISKALKKLSPRKKNVIKKLLIKIKLSDFENLDIKKLKNKDNIFRVRKGSIRIIFLVNKDQIKILTVERRSDNTYKKF
jgi:mRNA-degrading endonuclease RelE of RelBE toxin-antitoxin system